MADDECKAGKPVPMDLSGSCITCLLPWSCGTLLPSLFSLCNTLHRALALLRAELLPRRSRHAQEHFVTTTGPLARTDPLGDPTIDFGLSGRRGHKMATGLTFIKGHPSDANFHCRPTGSHGIGGAGLQAKTDRGGRREGRVRMEVVETPRFTGFDVLRAGQSSRLEGQSCCRREKTAPSRIKNSEGMYTEPYREAQNGNPG